MARYCRSVQVFSVVQEMASKLKQLLLLLTVPIKFHCMTIIKAIALCSEGCSHAYSTAITIPCELNISFQAISLIGLGIRVALQGHGRCAMKLQ